jgi:LysM repeat protein
MAVAKKIILCIICIITTNLWTLPVYAEQVHRVAPGETLSSIASRYGISIDSLLGNNQYIVNPDLIFPARF